MKQVLLSFLFLVTGLNLYSQNLTLSQLLELRKKNLGKAEEFLTSKGWEFMEAEEPKIETLGTATFTYKKSEIYDGAESFLIFLFTTDAIDENRINIQVNKKEKYNEYLGAIKGYGCELISSKVKDGNIVKVYRGATTTFRITASTSENYYNNETAIWFFFIVSNDDYDFNYTE